MLTATTPVPRPPVVNAAHRMLLRPASIAALLIAAGVVLHLRCLTWGFLLDDNLHQYVLRGLSTSRAPERDLYDFGPDGNLAEAAKEWHFQVWWADPAFNARFFRPVTSFSLRLDYRLFRDWAPGYHITSLLIFTIFLALVYRLYVRLDLSPRAALWALAVVALNQAHTLPVEWIANRNTLLAAVFTVSTLLGLLGWRRTGRPASALLAAVCFLLASGSKESGLVVIPLAVLVLLLGGPGARGGFRVAAARLQRDPLVWSLVAMGAAWLAFYILSGYGAHSDLYPSPWADTGGYLRRLAVLVPTALGSLFFCVPLDLVAACPQSTVWIALVILAAIVLTGWAYLRVVRRRRLAGLALGWIVVCLVVEAGGEVSDRLLMNATIGAGLLIGLFLDALGARRAVHTLRDRSAMTPGFSPKTLLPLRREGVLAHVLGVVLIGANLVAAVPVSFIRGQVFATAAAQDRQLLLDAEIDRSAPPPRDVFVLNAPSALMLIDCGPTWSMHYGDRDTCFYPLQAGRRGLVWTRMDERTMTLTAHGAPFLDHRLERLFRYRRVPQSGDTFSTKAFRATALAVDGNGIRTVRLEFDKPLEDPSYFFLRFHEGRLRRVDPPAPGQTLELAEVIPENPLVP